MTVQEQFNLIKVVILKRSACKMAIIEFMKNEDGVSLKKTENDLAGTHLKPIIYFHNPESENIK